mgnify:FL=1
MKKEQRAAYIVKRLNELYPSPKPPLVHQNNFELLIAVLLSAQCTDARVNLVTPKLFKLGNSPEAMLAMGVGMVQEIIRPCGLSPKKSKAIIELSKILIAHYAGGVPETLEDLEGLPGVGHKTASVVLSQGFGHNAFPVDTHIHRLAQRWGFTNGRNVEQTERDLKAIFPEEFWNNLHLQIIFYGREHCTARGCDGRCCEICKQCYPNRKHPVKIKK